MSKILCAGAVGCFMFAMLCTKQDFAQAMRLISKYMAFSESDHWQAVKWILKYPKGTRSNDIMFEKQYEGDALVASSILTMKEIWISDVTRRYVFTCGGGLVSWRFILQSINAFSTTDAHGIN